MLRILVILLVSSTSYAADLDSVMKEMKVKFTDISRQMGDATRNPSSSTMSLELSVLVLDAAQIVPPKLVGLPDAERELGYIEYRKLLAQLYVQALDLEKAFREARNADVRAILTEMERLRRLGHSMFLRSAGEFPASESRP